MGRTCKDDMAEGPGVASGDVEDDPTILEKDKVSGWAWIDSVELFKEGTGGVAGVESSEAGMETEIEPGVEDVDGGVSREKIEAQKGMPAVDKVVGNVAA